jgi:hypothetical protein
MIPMHPLIISRLAAEKRRDMLAQAERDRRASQLAALARASRRAERAQREMQKARRLVLRLRSELSQ